MRLSLFHAKSAPLIERGLSGLSGFTQIFFAGFVLPFSWWALREMCLLLVHAKSAK
jgi:hypothetical protein